METSGSIREFWFGTSADDAAVAREKSALWWAKDAATDQLMRERFSDCITMAAGGVLDGWLRNAHGRLALILLCDQFPRNIYRDTPQAFAFDALARAWSKDGIREGIDKLLRPIERVFFYLPLEHSESLADQHQSVALFEALADSVAADSRKDFAGYVDFAKHHRAIIERFHRFPHRNALLGRTSSAEEMAFLQGPGSSF